MNEAENYHNTAQSLVGVGLYSFGDAANYLQIPNTQLTRWTLGRTSRAVRASFQKIVPARTQSVLVSPVIKLERQRVLTFAQLIELRMVKLFRRNNVSMPVIKAAAREAARLLKTDHPFSSFQLKTDGNTIFAKMEPKNLEVEAGEFIADDGDLISPQTIVEDLARLQIVMEEIAEIYFLDTDYEDDMAAKWWLLGKNERAVLDPARGFGQPLDDTTGVPLRPLYSLIEAGETLRSVAEWYEVDQGAVETAIKFFNSELGWRLRN